MKSFLVLSMLLMGLGAQAETVEVKVSTSLSGTNILPPGCPGAKFKPSTRILKIDLQPLPTNGILSGSQEFPENVGSVLLNTRVHMAKDSTGKTYVDVVQARGNADEERLGEIEVTSGPIPKLKFYSSYLMVGSGACSMSLQPTVTLELN